MFEFLFANFSFMMITSIFILLKIGEKLYFFVASLNGSLPSDELASYDMAGGLRGLDAFWLLPTDELRKRFERTKGLLKTTLKNRFRLF